MHGDQAAGHGAGGGMQRQPFAGRELFRPVEKQEVRRAQVADSLRGLFLSQGLFAWILPIG